MTAPEIAPPGGGERPDPDPGRVDRPATWWRGLGAIALVALAVRVAFVLWASRPPVGIYDPGRYVGYANFIARGEGMIEGFTGEPTAYYPPGYPYFLGAIAWVLKHTPISDDLALAAGLVQAVLGAATVVGVGLVARRLSNPAGGLVAASTAALYPNLVMHTAVLLSETLFIALLIALLVALLPVPESGPWPADLSLRRLVVASLLLGAAVLVRPVSLPMVGVIGVVWWVATRDGRAALGRTALVGLIVVACVVPWTVRNAVRMDAFVPLSTNTGDNLCIGHAPRATGGFNFRRECDTGEGVQFGTASEVRNDDIKLARGLRFWRENLDREPEVMADRLRFTFRDDRDALFALVSYGLDPWLSVDRYELFGDIAQVAWVFVAVAGTAGLLRLAWSRRPDRLLLVLAVPANLLAPLVFFGDPRFKVPIVPLLCVGVGALAAGRGRLAGSGRSGDGLASDRPG